MLDVILDRQHLHGLASRKTLLILILLVRRINKRCRNPLRLRRLAGLFVSSLLRRLGIPLGKALAWFPVLVWKMLKLSLFVRTFRN